MTVPYRFKATSVGLHITMINDSRCQLAQILVSSGPDWGELYRFSGRTCGNWSTHHRIAGAWFSVAVKAVQRLKIYNQSWNSIGDVLQCVVSNVCEVSKRNCESVRPCVQVFRLNTDGRKPLRMCATIDVLLLWQTT